VEAVRVTKLSLVDRVLQIEYELGRKESDVTARILVLEHLAPELVARCDAPVQGLLLKNRKSLVESGLSWPPRPSPEPVLLR
jgi:hypothetical protein